MNFLFSKDKIFRDPVHGYISLSEDIVDLIVDNAYFQRLRRIEQSSMRCVYPSARHDRFAHSIGTYHLARIATSAIQKALEISASESGRIHDIRSLMFNFEMAALLHDIGHSPMSHTLENLFTESEDIPNMLNSRVGNLEFKMDLDYSSPSAHEIISSIIVWDCFQKELKELCSQRNFSLDLEFVVRCIIGAIHRNVTPNMYYKNALIRLLNSGAIDVDKLDYIKRDSIVSGYDNISVDTQRLLNSLTIVPFDESKKDAFTLAFGKSALSVVQNVVDCRNMLYTWIYGHHKVVYESDYLLIESVKKSIEKDKGILSRLFSVNAIVNDLCCDDDVWVMLKSQKGIPEVSELLDRRKHRIALWKTKVEFDLLFPRNEKTIAIGDFEVSKMIRAVDAWREGRKEYEEFCAYIDNEYCARGKSKAAIFIKPKIKVSAIKPNDVHIAINKKIYQYTSLEAVAEKTRDSTVVYVYIAEETLKKKYKDQLCNKKQEFIQEFANHIKNYPKFCLLPEYGK